MCLLDCLYCLKNELEIELVVAHINHMIRKEAEEETKYVKEYCKEIEVPCYIKYADITKLAKEKKLGTEEMGREIRYNFFEEIANKVKATKVATAHNKIDNVETVLMNIIRGSGLTGLKGIEAKSKKISSTIMTMTSAINKKDKINLEYIRPLIECERIEIEKYCNERNLNPKIDKSNFENIYTRNKIRNELIPYIQKEFNTNIIEGINRLSELAKEEEEYFKNIVQEVYETLKIGENEKEVILDLKKFNNLPKVIKERVLIYTIKKVIGTAQGIGKVHIEDMIKLCEKNIGNKYLTPNKNIKIFVKKGKIFLSTNL